MSIYHRRISVNYYKTYTRRITERAGIIERSTDPRVSRRAPAIETNLPLNSRSVFQGSISIAQNHRIFPDTYRRRTVIIQRGIRRLYRKNHGRKRVWRTKRQIVCQGWRWMKKWSENTRHEPLARTNWTESEQTSGIGQLSPPRLGSVPIELCPFVRDSTFASNAVLAHIDHFSSWQ